MEVGTWACQCREVRGVYLTVDHGPIFGATEFLDHGSVLTCAFVCCTGDVSLKVSVIRHVLWKYMGAQRVVSLRETLGLQKVSSAARV